MILVHRKFGRPRRQHRGDAALPQRGGFIDLLAGRRGSAVCHLLYRDMAARRAAAARHEGQLPHVGPVPLRSCAGSCRCVFYSNDVLLGRHVIGSVHCERLFLNAVIRAIFLLRARALAHAHRATPPRTSAARQRHQGCVRAGADRGARRRSRISRS